MNHRRRALRPSRQAIRRALACALATLAVTAALQVPGGSTARSQTPDRRSLVRHASGLLRHAASARTGAGPESAERLDVVGHVGGDIRDVASAAAGMVVTAGPRLQVWDAASPSRAHVTAESEPGAHLLDLVAATEVRAFALELDDADADESTACRGLRVFDLSDLAHVRAAGWVPCPSAVHDLDARGSTALLATSDGAVWVDASDPDDPVLGRILPGCGMAWDVRLEGEWAYVVGHPASEPEVAALLVYDLAKPGEERLIGRLDLGLRPSSLDVSGDTAYVVTSACSAEVGLEVIDVRDRRAPRRLAFVPLECGGTDVTAGPDHATVLGFDYQRMEPSVFVLDTSEPSQAHVVASAAAPWGRRLGRSPVADVVASGADGLRFLDAQRLADASIVAHVPVLGDARDGVLVADHAFVTDGTGELWALDLSDARRPTVAARARTNVDAAALVTRDGFVYVAQPDNPWSERSGLHVLDVRRPDAMRHVAFLTIVAESQDGGYDASPAPDQIAWAGDRLFVPTGRYGAGDTSGYWTVDLARAEQPRVRDFQPRNHELHGLAVRGDVAFAASGWDGLIAFDVGTGGRHDARSRLPLPGRSAHVAADTGSTVSVAAEDAGVRLVDVSEPAGMAEVGAITGVTATSAAQVGDRLLVPGTWASSVGGSPAAPPRPGIRVYDISDPRSPRFAAGLDTSAAGRLAVSDDRDAVLHAAGRLGVFVLRWEGAPTQSATATARATTPAPIRSATATARATTPAPIRSATAPSTVQPSTLPAASTTPTVHGTLTQTPHATPSGTVTAPTSGATTTASTPTATPHGDNGGRIAMPVAWR